MFTCACVLSFALTAHLFLDANRHLDTLSQRVATRIAFLYIPCLLSESHFSKLFAIEVAGFAAISESASLLSAYVFIFCSPTCTPRPTQPPTCGAVSRTCLALPEEYTALQSSLHLQERALNTIAQNISDLRDAHRTLRREVHSACILYM